jgi:hypothetical protein
LGYFQYKSAMENLNKDELILVMLSMKKKYEREIEILDNKFHSLASYCEERPGNVCTYLREYGKCGLCEDYTYIVTEIEEEEDYSYKCNYEKCRGCDMIICKICLNKEAGCKVERIPCISSVGGTFGMFSGITKKWCMECFRFKEKLKALK